MFFFFDFVHLWAEALGHEVPFNGDFTSVEVGNLREE